MPMIARWLGALVLVCMSAGMAVADNRAQAKQLYDEGLELYNQGKHAEAAAKYEQSYAALPTPLMLFNIGQAYRLAGEDQKAIDSYKKFIVEEPEGEPADKARGFIAQLEAKLEAERTIANAEATTPEADNTAPKDAMTPINTDDSASASSGGLYKYTGIGTGAVGVVLLGLGVKFGLDARSAAQDINNNDSQWTPTLLAREDEGESANTKMIVFTTSGALLTAAGAGLYLLGVRADREASDVAVVPAFSGDEVGFALTGSF